MARLDGETALGAMPVAQLIAGSAVAFVAGVCDHFHNCCADTGVQAQSANASASARDVLVMRVSLN